MLAIISLSQNTELFSSLTLAKSIYFDVSKVERDKSDCSNVVMYSKLTQTFDTKETVYAMILTYFRVQTTLEDNLQARKEEEMSFFFRPFYIILFYFIFDFDVLQPS